MSNSPLDQILETVTDPTEAVKETLRVMYVSVSRQFAAYDPDMVNVIADHYESLNKLLDRIEIAKETEK